MEPLLIAGIGNPGSSYSRTRHSIGHRVLDALVPSDQWQIHKKSRALYTLARFDGIPVHLAKTTCFMNESGNQIRLLSDYFSIPATNVLIVHDELDFSFGTIKLKKGGGEGGHNGLRSISQQLKTRDYVRLRIGIAHPGSSSAVVNYVLGNFTASEEKKIPEICIDAVHAIECFIHKGFVSAQNIVNTKIIL